MQKRRPAISIGSSLALALGLGLAAPRASASSPKEEEAAPGTDDDGASTEGEAKKGDLRAAALAELGWGAHGVADSPRDDTSIADASGLVTGLQIAFTSLRAPPKRRLLRFSGRYLSSWNLMVTETFPGGHTLDRPMRTHQVALSVAALWAFGRKRGLRAGAELGYAHEQFNSHVPVAMAAYAGRGPLLALPIELGGYGRRFRLDLVPTFRFLSLDEDSREAGYSSSTTVAGIRMGATLRLFRQVVLQGSFRFYRGSGGGSDLAINRDQLMVGASIGYDGTM